MNNEKVWIIIYRVLHPEVADMVRIACWETEKVGHTREDFRKFMKKLYRHDYGYDVNIKIIDCSLRPFYSGADIIHVYKYL